VCDLDQPFLFPPSLQDWLPEGHLARFVADVTDELDLSTIYAEYERNNGRGLSAYHPLLLTRLLLYGYSIGITSSRAIENATYDNIAFRYLAADQHPDHDTIASFRQQHLEALAGLFVQGLRLCHKAGLVKLGNIAIDGTKMLANASTRHSVSHQKLGEQEQYWQATVELSDFFWIPGIDGTFTSVWRVYLARSAFGCARISTPAGATAAPSGDPGPSADRYWFFRHRTHGSSTPAHLCAGVLPCVG
jgi:transposase